VKRHTSVLSAPFPLSQAVAQVAQIPLEQALILVREGAVYVDGRRARSAEAQVAAGATVTVVVDGSAAPAAEAAPRLDILVEDDDVLVVNKPPGVVSQPTPRGGGHSLLDLASAHLGHPAGLVHRLDAATSGVIVFGKHREATARLSLAFQEGRADKRYLAATGPGLPSRGTIDLSLAKDPANPKRWQASRAAGGIEARTDFERLADGEVCLVALFPKTGRTHQLRAHLAALGFPILGDRLYGGAKAGRCLLHAQSLRIDGASYEAPVPEDLEALFLAAGVATPHGW
jgi:23S rRNA pseudouridine1911/1915/1917 synthase